MDRTRVMVVEDEEFTRSMIVSALRLQGLDVVCETSSAGPALKMAETLRPNAAVVDLDLGVGPNGIDIAIALRRRHPAIGIVILTTYEDPRLIAPKIPNPPIGAVYLIKRQVGDIEMLYKSIQKSIANIVHIGGAQIPSITYAPALEDITDSQLDTMRLLSKGLSNSEIAKLRNVTEKSVEQSIARLVRNLNISKGKSFNQRVQISRLYFKLTGSKVQNEE